VERERDKQTGGAESTPVKQPLQGNLLIMHPASHFLSFLICDLILSTDLAGLPPSLDTQSASEAGLTGMDHCSQSLSQFYFSQADVHHMLMV